MTQAENKKIDDFAKRVMEADEESARVPFWTPQEGDVLIGRITNISVEEGTFGEREVYTIYDELLESYVRVGSSAVLAARLRDYGVTVGDRVGIKYLGKKTGKNKKQYNIYAVFVDENDRAAARSNNAQPNAAQDDEEIPF